MQLNQRYAIKMFVLCKVTAFACTNHKSLSINHSSMSLPSTEVSNVCDHLEKPALLCISSAWTLSKHEYYCALFFAIPLATSVEVDPGSAMVVGAGAHVCQVGSIDVRSDSNPAILKAMATHSCYYGITPSGGR